MENYAEASMVLTLKNGFNFSINDIVYIKDPNIKGFLIKSYYTDYPNLQQLYFDLEDNLTKENISEVKCSYVDGRDDMYFNFTNISRMSLNVTEETALIEIVMTI